MKNLEAVKKALAAVKCSCVAPNNPCWHAPHCWIPGVKEALELLPAIEAEAALMGKVVEDAKGVTRNHWSDGHVNENCRLVALPRLNALSDSLAALDAGKL